MAHEPENKSPEKARAIAQAKADSGAHRMAQEAIGGAVTVREAIESYLERMRADGARERSAETAGHQMRRFFGRTLDQPLDAVTPRRAADLYEALRRALKPNGEPIAVRTQQECLKQAKALYGWCVEQRLVRLNPISDVKPVGLASRGKPQLRIDEAKKLTALCLTRAGHGEGGTLDDGALAVLLALLLGLRAGEIVSRAVRDLDDGGRVLWIDDTASGWRTKSRAGKRRIEVPAVLRPLLKLRVDGKLSTELLFASPYTGGMHGEDWVTSNVHRFCKAAGVPLVCAHGLRGQHATIAIRAGATSHLVALALGHESEQVTLNHYALPGSADAAAALLAQQHLLN